METAGARLDSWKEIAAYIGKDVRTAMRWEKTRGLPVHRLPGGYRSAVFAYTAEVAKWLESAGVSNDTFEDDSTEVAEVSSPEDDGDKHRLDGPVRLAESGSEIPARIPGRWGRAVRWLLIPAGVLLLVVLVVAAVRSHLPLPPLHLSDEVQLTNDGVPIRGLVTDGRFLYFTERKDGRSFIASMPVTGGQSREVRTPFPFPLPVAISPDGSRLLVITSDGEEKERAIWGVPLNGGIPQRVGNFLCHSAAWSPEGGQIAFASGNSIYLTDPAGNAPRLLQTFAEVPQNLHWSLDGKRLLFRLRNTEKQESTLWELDWAETGSNAIDSITSLQIPSMKDCCTQISSPIDDQDSSFIANTENQDNRILLLAKTRSLLKPRFQLTEVSHEPSQPFEVERDPLAQRLFIVRSSLIRYELMRFDLKSHGFRPFLPGVDGLDVNFAPDGKLIAYVRMPERSLWVGASDGSATQRISPVSLSEIELPRWSPDGKWIAFTGRQTGQPWRIFLVRPDGSEMHEASTGTDSQGAPTWSPDGRSIYYGNLRCEEQGTCSIHGIELSSGHEYTIQGSEGLTTARSSPNGRFIAALRTDHQQVYLFDQKQKKWTRLAEGLNGNDLVWSRDSRSLYASCTREGRPEVIKISIPDGQLSPSVDLSDLNRLPGTVNTWFEVAPDGAESHCQLREKRLLEILLPATSN